MTTHSPYPRPSHRQPLTTSSFQQLEFARQFSLDEKNIVVGLVRDKAAAEKKTVQLFSGRSNVHFVQAELADYKSLQVQSIE